MLISLRTYNIFIIPIAIFNGYDIIPNTKKKKIQNIKLKKSNLVKIILHFIALSLEPTQQQTIKSLSPHIYFQSTYVI